MKAVLISVHPKWCELIARGKKTIEVRKTRPKIETPFKCYIYQTNKNAGLKHFDQDSNKLNDFLILKKCGKVIGEFVCDKVDQITEATAGIYFADKDFNILDGENELKKTCLSVDELANYLGEDKNGLCKNGYAWHITDLKIYDEPRELGEFRKVCAIKNKDCANCEFYSDYSGTCINYLTRPPQSWQYVEEL